MIVADTLWWDLFHWTHCEIQTAKHCYPKLLSCISAVSEYCLQWQWCVQNCTLFYDSVI